MLPLLPAAEPPIGAFEEGELVDHLLGDVMKSPAGKMPH